ncbi:MAG: hypothetical protein J1F12_07390 [Muribaculaceae bacterium]|nr:hypothetical protein [Muribaculaceae bacterium]
MKPKFCCNLIALLLLWFTGIFSLYSQTMRVYSVEGNVEKKTENKWVALKKLMEIQPSDKINIGPESSIRIMDTGKHVVYTFQQNGEFTVSDLLDKIKKENSSLTSKIIAESRKNLNSGKSSSAKLIGAALRGELDENEIENLYSQIKYFLKNPSKMGNLKVEKIYLDDSLFNFRVTNETAQPIFFNILSKDTNDFWLPLFENDGESGILSFPEEVIDIDHLTFVDEPDILYIGIGYPAEFPAEEIQYRLNENMDPLEMDSSLYPSVLLFLIE